MARPRKPTAVKRLQGTLQPCRTNKNEPIPQTDLKTLVAPDYLCESAKEIWTFAVDQAPEGMLSSLDLAIFTQWVVCFDSFIKLNNRLNETGVIDENGKVSDVLHHVTKTAAILCRLENELGFTPASRSKVASYRQTDKGTENKFADL